MKTRRAAKTRCRSSERDRDGESKVAHIAEKYSLAQKEQEDFRAMLVRENERRKSDG